MTLKVIGAGFGRTGTLSLKSALDELGLGPCYQDARPSRARPDVARAGEGRSLRLAADAEGLRLDRRLAEHLFLEATRRANPDAKIILTLRDPEAWYRSAAATIFARILEFEALRADPDAVDEARRRHMEMVNTIVVEKTFGGSLEKHHAIQVFNAHNGDVRRSLPREKLLVYESCEGWEPLCDFLGLPVPATPYPKVNTTGDFVSRFPGKR
jgi:sulfotransferase family protein